MFIIIADFLLTPEMQMLPNYHHLSCVVMKKEKKMKKKKQSVLVLYNKRMIYWYLSSISDAIFVLRVNYRLFSFPFWFPFCVFFGMILWRLLFRSRQPQHLRFSSDSRRRRRRTTAQKSVSGVAWSRTRVNRLMTEARCFSLDYDDMPILILKNYNV